MKRRGWLGAALVTIAAWAGIGAGVYAVAGCATAPRDYVLCNEMGDEPGCGENVSVTVE